MTKCSIIILSWQRQDNINLIINEYNKYSIVEEIIVWNNNKNYLISNLELEKVKTINCDQDFGLNSRFVSCLLAKSRCVIAHDDDLFLSEINLSNLVENFEKDYSRIYTYEGRNSINGFYTYDFEGRVENVKEQVECEISLTRATCFDKFYAAEYLKLSDVLFYDVDINLNGEDVAFSKMVSSLCGKQPLVLPLIDEDGYKELPVTESISTRENHLNRRTEILNRSKILFPMPKYYEEDNKKTVFFGNGFYPFAYLKDSINSNSIYKKIIAKEINGIKYLSINNSDEFAWSAGCFLVDKDSNLDEILKVSCFYMGPETTVGVQLGYVVDNTDFVSNRIILEAQPNLPKDFFIEMKEIINHEKFKINRIIFIFDNKENTEFCITELSILSP